MGRKTLPNAKQHIGCRVEPEVKRAVDSIAVAGQWKPSQALEIIVKESPRVKAEIRKNGKGKK